jgi:transcriptional regulator with XRE-family HTH domain
MPNEVIIQISSKLKDYRKSKGITIQQLADRAQVSKGLISQIENNRTIPSLLVLINLIRSLGVDLNDFFADVEQTSESKVVVKRNDEYQPFEKEQSKGFLYKRVMTRNIQNLPTDIVILELAPRATRSFMVKTNAFEYKYIINGCVEYAVGDQKYTLNTGDSIFFDANLPHKPTNVGDTTALMLVMYFFKE